MIKFLAGTSLGFFIILVLLAGAQYFADKDYLINELLSFPPADSLVDLGEVSFFNS